MREFFTWLEGSKTNIGIVLTSILTTIRTQGLAPESWNPWIELALVLIATFTGLAAKASLRRVEKAQATAVLVTRETAADVRDAAVAVTEAAEQIAKLPTVDYSPTNPPRFDGGR